MLRNKVIRLAYENPKLRSHLLPILKEAGCEKLPKALREQCEKKVEEGKKASESDVLRAEQYFDNLGFWFKDKIDHLRELAYDYKKEYEDTLTESEVLSDIWDKDPSKWSARDMGVLRKMMTRRQFNEMDRHYTTLFY